ncbi:hypothetical protein GF359_09755 [candidate division WOR-3 bacterium]|uniref:Lipoprotein n=1 Tax=candidate division WOR-3 bacterium TaxID=2052148 RepID=A0A9D5KB36_UNCW3|nr:hypothetical protein [candidate division WOR-3 bacterium]MBD3365484.1 hypothetical protein [candidate division WOR-3 bacterium]
MKKVLPVLIVLVLAACTPKALKPAKEKRIKALYNSSTTSVRVIGEPKAVKKGAKVTIRGTDGTIADTTTARKDGSFDAFFCAGEWARENLNCDYFGDAYPGDWIRVEYSWEGLTSPPTLVQIWSR